MIKLENPEKWKYEYIQSGFVHSYFLENDDVEKSLLYFCTPPIAVDEYNARKMVDEEINFFLTKAKKRKEENTDLVRVENQEIIGLEFTGYSIIMFHKESYLLGLFSITDGHIVLTGHFTGPNEKWETAKKILKSLKYKG